MAVWYADTACDLSLVSAAKSILECTGATFINISNILLIHVDGNDAQIMFLLNRRSNSG